MGERDDERAEQGPDGEPPGGGGPTTAAGTAGTIARPDGPDPMDALEGVDGVDGDLRRIATLPDRTTAEEAGRTLVEQGVGPVIRAAVPAGGPVDDAAAPVEVWVLVDQVAKACAVLGVDPPAVVAQESAAAADEARPPWKRILVVWAIAMVVIPLAAGYLTFVLLSR